MKHIKDKFKELSSQQMLALLGIVILCLLLAAGLALRPQQEEPAEQTEGSRLITAEQLPGQAVTAAEDGRAVMVLNYHKVQTEHMSLSVNIEDFEKHMKWLKEYGYTSITPDELYAFVTEGAPLPEKPVLITFDDGYKDNYTNAYPIMKKYGFKGTIFVVTSFLGTYDNYLTWAQAKELLDNGFSIESHTYTHRSMTEASDADISQELVKSKEMLKEKLGIDAGFIAYPTGTYNLHIADLVQQAGYKGAFTIKYDNVTRDSNVYALERVPIFHTEDTNKDFLERIRYFPLFSKYGWDKN